MFRSPRRLAAVASLVALLAVVAVFALRGRAPDDRTPNPFGVRQADRLVLRKIRVIDPDDPTIPATVPAPGLTIVEPKDGQGFKKGSPIAVEFTVHMPEGAHPPTFLSVQFLQDGVLCGEGEVTQTGRTEGGGYLFTSRIKTPKKPARYSVRALAVVVQMTQRKTDAQAMGNKTFETQSPAIPIEVQP